MDLYARESNASTRIFTAPEKLSIWEGVKSLGWRANFFLFGLAAPTDAHLWNDWRQRLNQDGPVLPVHASRYSNKMPPQYSQAMTRFWSAALSKKNLEARTIERIAESYNRKSVKKNIRDAQGRVMTIMQRNPAPAAFYEYIEAQLNMGATLGEEFFDALMSNRFPAPGTSEWRGVIDLCATYGLPQGTRIRGPGRSARKEPVLGALVAHGASTGDITRLIQAGVGLDSLQDSIACAMQPGKHEFLPLFMAAGGNLSLVNGTTLTDLAIKNHIDAMRTASAPDRLRIAESLRLCLRMLDRHGESLLDRRNPLNSPQSVKVRQRVTAIITDPSSPPEICHALLDGVHYASHVNREELPPYPSLAQIPVTHTPPPALTYTQMRFQRVVTTNVIQDVLALDPAKAARVAQVMLALKPTGTRAPIDPNYPSPDTGHTLLTAALESHNRPLIMHLLKHPSVNVNAADGNGKTPLFVAIDHMLQTGQTEYVDLLLSDPQQTGIRASAAPDWISPSGETLFSYIKNHGGTDDMVEYLQSRYKIDIPSKESVFSTAEFSPDPIKHDLLEFNVDPFAEAAPSQQNPVYTQPPTRTEIRKSDPVGLSDAIKQRLTAIDVALSEGNIAIVTAGLKGFDYAQIIDSIAWARCRFDEKPELAKELEKTFVTMFTALSEEAQANLAEALRLRPSYNMILAQNSLGYPEELDITKLLSPAQPTNNSPEVKSAQPDASKPYDGPRFEF